LINSTNATTISASRITAAYIYGDHWAKKYIEEYGRINRAIFRALIDPPPLKYAKAKKAKK